MARQPSISGAIDTGRLGGRVRTGSFAFHRKQSGLSVRSSMDDINAKYSAFVAKLHGVTQEVMREALTPAFEKSQVYVPVDKGNLKASGRITSSASGTKVTASIIYGNASSKYAAIVHERLDLHHKAPTRAKFLQSAMQEEFDSFLVHLAMGYVAKVTP